jgi:hypothetical protein
MGGAQRLRFVKCDGAEVAWFNAKRPARYQQQQRTAGSPRLAAKTATSELSFGMSRAAKPELRRFVLAQHDQGLLPVLRRVFVRLLRDAISGKFDDPTDA